MRLLVLTVVAIALLYGGAAGCDAEDKASAIPQEAGARAVRLRLESAGFRTEWVSFRWRADFFGPSVRQATLGVDGADTYLQFYRFQDAAQAAKAAAGVSASGSSVPADGGIAQVSWAGEPHFFRRDRLIVLFVAEGDDLQRPDSRSRLILDVLREVAGPQFAGASPADE